MPQVRVLMVAVLLAWAPAARAQIGGGWVSYTPESQIHLDGSAGIESYPGSTTSKKNEGASFNRTGEVETFTVFDRISNRAERRLKNDYRTGRRQFEGEVRVWPPTSDQSVMQIFGGTSPATTQMLRAYASGGGTLKKVPGAVTLATRIYGRWIRINVIHDIAANTVKTYVDGKLMATGDGEAPSRWYHKYGCYGTLKSASAKVEWRHVRHFRDANTDAYRVPAEDVAVGPGADDSAGEGDADEEPTSEPDVAKAPPAFGCDVGGRPGGAAAVAWGALIVVLGLARMRHGALRRGSRATGAIAGGRALVALVGAALLVSPLGCGPDGHRDVWSDLPPDDEEPGGGGVATGDRAAGTGGRGGRGEGAGGSVGVDAGPRADDVTPEDASLATSADAAGASSAGADAALAALPSADAAGPACGDGPCASKGGLVLHWKFDERSGAIAEDASGNGLRGSYVALAGVPAASRDVAPVRFTNPRSRTFARADQQAVQLLGMPPALKPTTELTVAAWYRTATLDTGAGGAAGAASEVLSAGDNYLLRLRANEIEVSKRVGGTVGWVRCLGVVSNHHDGAWHHLAAVIDRQTLRLYFDGAETCALPDAAPLVYDRGNDFWVATHGQGKTSYRFDGNIDEVRVYDRALTAAELAALAAGD